MPDTKTLEEFIAAVESNKHVDAIERFYADDASMQENLGEPRKGRDALVAGEAAFLKMWKEVRSQCVRPAFHDGDKVVIRWIFEFTGQDGQQRRMEELAYQRWRGNKIVEEQFFYDPAQMR
jgi:ketosteroid isomerase-like protein